MSSTTYLDSLVLGKVFNDHRNFLFECGYPFFKNLNAVFLEPGFK